MVKEVLLNTSGGGGAFERMPETPLVKYLLGDGLFRLRGQKWAKHRRIITPAFNMERVKVSFIFIYSFISNIFIENISCEVNNWK